MKILFKLKYYNLDMHNSIYYILVPLIHG